MRPALTIATLEGNTSTVAFERVSAVPNSGGSTMKRFIISLAALFVTMAWVEAANAAVCAAGVYRAGCAGARGAVVVRRPVAHCAVVNGVRVCR
jgi:hypothetical protein